MIDLEMALDEALLEILACPVCKGKLLYLAKKDQLICRFDQLAYPIIEGIPVMLIEKAQKITEGES